MVFYWNPKHPGGWAGFHLRVGSLKSPFQQWRTIGLDTLGEGEKIVARMLATKMRKGYIQKAK
jgi:hypothetical protein